MEHCIKNQLFIPISWLIYTYSQTVDDFQSTYELDP